MDWFPTRRYAAPLTGRGYILFVNIRPDQQSPQFWFCDECGRRVTTARQERHVRDHL